MGICSSTARCDPAVTPISPVAPLPTNDVTEKESQGGEGMEAKEDVEVVVEGKKPLGLPASIDDPGIATAIPFDGDDGAATVAAPALAAAGAPAPFANPPVTTEPTTEKVTGDLREEVSAGPMEVWEYTGTASNASSGELFGHYCFRHVVFDRTTRTVTMDTEYTPSSETSIEGYLSRDQMAWACDGDGHVGNKGESWQGTLIGNSPGGGMDIRNKWGNRLIFTAVKRLPLSALTDEGNPNPSASPVPVDQHTTSTAAVPRDSSVDTVAAASVVPSGALALPATATEAENQQQQEGEEEEEEEDADGSLEVWEYKGSASDAHSTVLYGHYHLRRVLFDRTTRMVTMDTEYAPLSEGSVGGYRSRDQMAWACDGDGHIGNKGESWQGTLIGNAPGGGMDIRNKWRNRLIFAAVKRLPLSALMDEDNPPPVEPFPVNQRTVSAAVVVPADGGGGVVTAGVGDSATCWAAALDFIDNPTPPRKDLAAMSPTDTAMARRRALAWTLAALDDDLYDVERVHAVKRLFAIRRFTTALSPDEMAVVMRRCSSELDRIGAGLKLYYEAEKLQAALGNVGAAATAENGAIQPRQHDVIPTPRTGSVYPDSSGVTMSEHSYIFMLILVAQGIDADFQKRAETAARAAAANCDYRAAPPKSFPRMYNKLWSDHRTAGAPRPSKNLDVVRALISVPDSPTLSRVFEAVGAAFGGVAFCKNNFGDPDGAAITSHYRAVYAIVKYEPTEPLTYGALAQREMAAWTTFAEARDPLEQPAVHRAINWMAKGPLKDVPVKMFCELQLLLDEYTRTRESMHLYYKMERATDPDALWRDFSCRVQPQPFEAGSLIK